MSTNSNTSLATMFTWHLAISNSCSVAQTWKVYGGRLLSMVIHY